MKLLIQKVSKASVEIENKIFSSIDNGLLVFIGISKDCNEEKVNYLVEKLLNFRIFQSDKKGFDLSIKNVNQEILIVSQFTLFANTKNGRKPSFNDAMPPIKAKEFYDLFIQKLKENSNLNIKTGKFGAIMKINLINDGPITLLIEK